MVKFQINNFIRGINLKGHNIIYYIPTEINALPTSI